MHGHGAHDDMSYVPPGMLERWAKRDPIERYARRLVAEHGFSEHEVEEIRGDVHDYVEQCAAKALDSPMPDARTAADGVFAECWEPLGDGRSPRSAGRDESESGNGSAPHGNGARA
jgi:TPP-dependent pyruvate/acetoin dehydrogenase alpha subunit